MTTPRTNVVFLSPRELEKTTATGAMQLPTTNTGEEMHLVSALSRRRVNSTFIQMHADNVLTTCTLYQCIIHVISMPHGPGWDELLSPDAPARHGVPY